MPMNTALHMFADNAEQLEEQWKERDAAQGKERAEAFYDTKFRVKRTNGEYKEIPAPDPALEGPVADVHCHLSMLDNRDLTLARAAFYGVNLMCCVSDICEDAGTVYTGIGGWTMSASAWQHVIDPDSFLFDPIIRLICGCHPHNAKDYNSSVETGLLERVADTRTGALGEIGLDYHSDLSPRCSWRIERACPSSSISARRTTTPCASSTRRACPKAAPSCTASTWAWPRSSLGWSAAAISASVDR